MLNNIIKIRKKYNLSIKLCKLYLEKFKNNYNNTINYIEKINYNFNKKFNENIIINFYNNNKLYILKLKFNSIIIKNSTIIKKIILELEKIKNIKKKIQIFFSIYSIKLNEFILIDKILCLRNKNILFYNHNKVFISIIKYKSEINKFLCYQIIFKRIKFINLKKCSLNLFFQKQFNNNNLVSNMFNKKDIIYIYKISEHFFNFYYE